MLSYICVQSVMLSGISLCEGRGVLTPYRWLHDAAGVESSAGRNECQVHSSATLSLEQYSPPR